MTIAGRRPIACASAAVVFLICGHQLVSQRSVERSQSAGAWQVPRTPDGHPDLQGFWTNNTATPFQRPTELAGKEFFTEAEAAEYERTALDRLVKETDDDKLAADLNYDYLDYRKVGESRRTSLIVDPPAGRLPDLLPQARQRATAKPPSSSDDPEVIGLDERCLLAVALGSSNSSPPIVPNPFGQNFYQIVQTPQHVTIFSELVHDARIVRMNGKHPPASVQNWLGDSIGRWEGDTLVVDTTNFTAKTRFYGSSERLHVVERFSRADQNTIQYRVTVDDPETWVSSWTAEIPFKATGNRIFEYACHEANYAMAGILRGARVAEREAATKPN